MLGLLSWMVGPSGSQGPSGSRGPKGDTGDPGTTTVIYVTSSIAPTVDSSSLPSEPAPVDPAAAVTLSTLTVRELDGSTILERIISNSLFGDPHHARMNDIFVDERDLYLTRPLLIERVAHGGEIRGRGVGGTWVHYVGQPLPDGAAIIQRGTRGVGFSDMTFCTHAQLRSWFLNATAASEQTDRQTSTAHRFRHLRINGYGADLYDGNRQKVLLASGIEWGPTPAEETLVWDSNNEFGLCYDVSVYGISRSAFRIRGSQAKTHRFYACDSEGGLYLIECEAGSFEWNDGHGGNHDIADFFCAGKWDNIKIDGANLENSQCLFSTPCSGAPMPVSIRNVRWSGREVITDPRVVIHHGIGPFSLTNSVIGEGGPRREVLDLASCTAGWAVEVSNVAFARNGSIRNVEYWLPGGPNGLPGTFRWGPNTYRGFSTNDIANASAYAGRATIDARFTPEMAARDNVIPDGEISWRVKSSDVIYTANIPDQWGRPKPFGMIEGAWPDRRITLIINDDATTLLHRMTDGAFWLADEQNITPKKGSSFEFVFDWVQDRWVEVNRLLK